MINKNFENCEYLKGDFIFLEQIRANLMDAIISNKTIEAKKLNMFLKHYLKLFSSSGEEHERALNYFKANPDKHILSTLIELLSNYSERNDMEMVKHITKVINKILKESNMNESKNEEENLDTVF